MEKKKSINLGFRGWMLVIWTVSAFVAYTVIGNYPLNVLADMYGGAGTVSTIYTVASIIGLVIQFVFSGKIGKIKSNKNFAVILGIVTIICMLGVMFIPPTNLLLWQICYGVGTVISMFYGVLALSVVIGQWFPRRKGTVIGIATLAFPVCNALVAFFAKAVFSSEIPNVAGGYMPFLIVVVVGFLIGIFLVKDYPEQCGAYRDNDKSMTPEIAQKMMEEEMENKKTSVWKLGRTISSPDYWFATIPMGMLLFFAIGMMTQTAGIIMPFEEQLSFIGGFSGVMMITAAFGCLGSYFMGLIDTKLGTKKAIIISVCCLIAGGILGFIPSAITLFVSFLFLGTFMGAASNYPISLAVQYWRHEDFPSVYSCIYPIANLISNFGPMIVARLLYSTMGYQAIFLTAGIAGIVSLVLILLFNPARIKAKDDILRENAGKPLDDALVGKK